jgi:hypothetical protein
MLFQKLAAFLLVLCMSLVFALPMVGTVSAYTSAYPDQWYGSYDYCKSISVSSVEDVLNYQVRLNIFKGSGTDAGLSVYLLGHSLNWPYDIRFSTVDGDSLDFWRESYDTNGGIWWVEVGAMSAHPALDSYIYVFYGNATADDASNGVLTFPFFDDFSDAPALPNNPVINGNVSGHYNGPGSVIVKADNDDLIVFNREGVAHGGTNPGDYAVVTKWRSQDNGVTWVDEGVFLSVSNMDCRNMGVGVTSTGRIILLVSVYDVESLPLRWDSIRITYSDDDGVTWSSWYNLPILPVDINGNHFNMTTFSAGYNVVSFEDGRVGISYYGHEVATAYHYCQSVFAVSTDDGATFPIANHYTILQGESHADENQWWSETNVAYLGDGRLIAITRINDDTDMEVSKSSTYGSTWNDMGKTGLCPSNGATGSTMTYYNETGALNVALVYCDYAGDGSVKGATANADAIFNYQECWQNNRTIRVGNPANTHFGMPIIAINGAYGFVVSYEAFGAGSPDYVGPANVYVDRWTMYDDSVWISVEGTWTVVSSAIYDSVQDGTNWDRAKCLYSYGNSAWRFNMKQVPSGSEGNYSSGIIINSIYQDGTNYDRGYQFAVYPNAGSSYSNKARINELNTNSYVGMLDEAYVKTLNNTYYVSEGRYVSGHLTMYVGDVKRAEANDTSFPSGTYVRLYSTKADVSTFAWILQRDIIDVEPTFVVGTEIRFPDWEDVTQFDITMMAMVWLFITFLPAIMLSMRYGSNGFMVGLLVMTTVYGFGNVVDNFLFVAIISYACAVAIYMKGD